MYSCLTPLVCLPMVHIYQNEKIRLNIWVNYFISISVYTFFFPLCFKTIKFDTSPMGKYKIDTLLVPVNPN
jgi:hypothetical protein